MKARWHPLLAIAGALALATLGTPLALAQPGGGDEEPITLSLSVQDVRGRQSEPAAEDLVRIADEVSGGTLTIDGTFEGGDVAAAVRDGTADLGMVPTRDFHLLGVSSLDALEAPFLIDDDALAIAIARSDIAERAMSGLEAIGISGLAMWPEDLRHLFAFDASGKTFTAPADLDGADVLVVAGKPGHDLITTLGGHIYEEGTAVGDLTGDRGADAQAGTLEGMVTGLWGAGLPSYDATVAGDLVLHSKYQMLIANRDMLESLTDGQLALLDKAVAAMQEAAIERHFSEAELAEQLCAAGGTVIEAGPDALAAFRSAAQPLPDALATDPLTAELMEDIAALDESTAEAPGAGTCGGAAATDAQATTPADSITSAPSAEGFLSSAPPHGTYEITVTAPTLQGAGASASFANLNAGTWTWSMSGGWWEAWHDPGDEHCWGTYMAEGNVVRFVDGSETTTCALGYDLRWQPVDGGITLEILGTNWTEATAQVLADERALAQRPWARIADARKPSVFGGFTLGPPPDGTYRTELLATEMQARGASSQYAGENAGTWTLRFSGGTWEAARPSHDEFCFGTYEAVDDVVRFTDVPGGGCWWGGDYRFRPQGDGISILFVDWVGGGTAAEHQDWRSFLYEPWTRIADGSQPLAPGAGAAASPAAAPVAALPPDGVKAEDLKVEP